MNVPTVAEMPHISVVPTTQRDEPLYEIVNGKRVSLEMSAYSVRVGSRLSRLMGHFGDAHDLGEVASENLFRLRLPGDQCRCPDVAFVSFERWAKGRPMPLRGDAWDVVPDLMAEVVSPTDRAEDLMKKIIEYFQAGVRQVWVIYPIQRFVLVYESLTRVRGFTDADELDGGDVLPGFRTPVAGLFPAAAPEV